jgi:hypothetical protein
VYAWAFYCASIGALFAVLKAANYGLHHMFDTSEGIQEVSKPDTSLQVDVEKPQTSTNQMQACAAIFLNFYLQNVVYFLQGRRRHRDDHFRA